MTEITIKDLDAPELLPFTDTSELELKNKLSLFVAESPKVIRTALDAGYEPVSLLMQKKYIAGQGADITARLSGVPIYTAEPGILERLTGYKLTQGMLCAFRRKRLPSPEELLKGSVRAAVLESVMNQTNTGAIFRSAAALGFDAVLLTPSCSDPLFRRSVRVSMGSVFLIPWTYLDNEESYVDFLRDHSFSSAAMALSDSSVGIDDPKLLAEKRLALIFGTEGEGLRASTIAACDYTVKIPMYHCVDSLNVAAASAVAFWQLRKRD